MRLAKIPLFSMCCWGTVTIGRTLVSCCQPEDKIQQANHWNIFVAFANIQQHSRSRRRKRRKKGDWLDLLEQMWKHWFQGFGSRNWFLPSFVCGSWLRGSTVSSTVRLIWARIAALWNDWLAFCFLQACRFEWTLALFFEFDWVGSQTKIRKIADARSIVVCGKSLVRSRSCLPCFFKNARLRARIGTLTASSSGRWKLALFNDYRICLYIQDVATTYESLGSSLAEQQ